MFRQISDWEEIFANRPFSAFFSDFEILNGPFHIILHRLWWAIFQVNGTMAHGPLPSQSLPNYTLEADEIIFHIQQHKDMGIQTVTTSLSFSTFNKFGRLKFLACSNFPSNTHINLFWSYIMFFLIFSRNAAYSNQSTKTLQSWRGLKGVQWQHVGNIHLSRQTISFYTILLCMLCTFTFFWVKWLDTCTMK